MQPNFMELSKYRMEKAEEDLSAARLNAENGLYKVSINRSYYAIFHALRAVNILDSFDASKHSSVIAHFNQYYVHTGVFPKDISKLINSAYRIREKCDYSDFFVVSKEDAQKQLQNAESFIETVKKYLNERGKQDV